MRVSESHKKPDSAKAIPLGQTMVTVNQNICLVCLSRPQPVYGNKGHCVTVMAILMMVAAIRGVTYQEGASFSPPYGVDTIVRPVVLRRRN